MLEEVETVLKALLVLSISWMSVADVIISYSLVISL